MSTTDSNIKNVKVTSKFWNRYRKLIVKEVLPYQWKVMNDEANINIASDPQNVGIDKNSHAVANLKIAAGEMKGHHYGFPFQDTDVYKWLEAAAYSFNYQPNDDLKKITDSLIDLIADAQDDDGYLSTYFQIDAPERKFKRLQQSHELYTMGHYIEAGVAYYQVTENKKALNIAIKMANCINDNFGAESGKIHGVDGHPEIELALARLYDVTKKEKYLDLAHYFLTERGKDPSFFDRQIEKDGTSEDRDIIPGMQEQPLTYYQAAEPIKDQEKADGHAVRVVYLCTGMAHVARLTGDKDLLEACSRFWNNIVKRRMYITGNIGSTTTGEAFTYDYDLPNDTMYGETCASVGMAFFAKQMLSINSKGEYGDILEKELFNGALSGIALDGKHFFYVNPLEADPVASQKNPGKTHVLTHRADWFGCACCPANLARLIASIDQYLYTEKEGVLLSHQFIANDTTLKNGTIIKQTNNFPWDGKINYKIENSNEDFKFGIRIPSWSQDNFTLKVNGQESYIDSEDGFIYIDVMSKELNIELTLDMDVKFMKTNNLVKDNIGKVALMRGPLVYCAEEEDNNAPLWLYKIYTNKEVDVKYKSNLLKGVVSIAAYAEREQEDSERGSLYTEERSKKNSLETMYLIPYYAWANRSNGQMISWIREKNS